MNDQPHAIVIATGIDYQVWVRLTGQPDVYGHHLADFPIYPGRSPSGSQEALQYRDMLNQREAPHEEH